MKSHRRIRYLGMSKLSNPKIPLANQLLGRFQVGRSALQWEWAWNVSSRLAEGGKLCMTMTAGVLSTARQGVQVLISRP
jgi:hypothetical protein